VTGTLWDLGDIHAANVSRQIYQQLKHSETDGVAASSAAMALDHAVVALRSRRPTQPWLWACHIHIGP